MKIAIHGAGGTGKKFLAAALAHSLDQLGRRPVSISVSPPLDSTDSALTLVCGLDWTEFDTSADLGLGAQRESEDRLLREQLTAARVEFRVIYGSGSVRVANAMKAVNETQSAALVNQSCAAPLILDASDTVKWRWDCDKCSDSSCEHFLFSKFIG